MILTKFDDLCASIRILFTNRVEAFFLAIFGIVRKLDERLLLEKIDKKLDYMKKKML